MLKVLLVLCLAFPTLGMVAAQIGNHIWKLQGAIPCPLQTHKGMPWQSHGDFGLMTCRAGGSARREMQADDFMAQAVPV